MRNPELIVYAGPMFSSKTTKLLSTLEKYKYQKKKAIVFKPGIDDRYSTTAVVSHGGWSVPAVTISNGAELLKHLAEIEGKVDVVAVDEAFMIDNISDALIWLYRNGYTVVISTLDVSARGKIFDGVGQLFAWATHIEKCAAVCTVCSHDARYTHRKNISDDEIQVGGSELYEPRCFAHHVYINKSEST